MDLAAALTALQQAAETLLVRDGRLTAVVDFGGLSVGDPTVDLVVAWEILDPPAREVLRRRLGVEDAAWVKGRAWALSITLTIWYYWTTTLCGRCVGQDHGILTAMAPWTLNDIERAFRVSWAADTCSPDDVERAGWQADNPAWGHCDVTALLLSHIFGGDLMVGEVYWDGVRHGFHWWNRLSSGVEVDLTREQFRDGQVVTSPRVVKRPTGRPARRYDEYKLLRARVSAHLGPLPGPPDDEASLVGLIRSNAWLLRVLTAVRDEHLPDAWVGAGVLRDLVWGERYGSGFSPERVRDVDVAFFDPHDLSRGNDDRVTERLGQRLSHVPWEACNQAAVHTWYPGKFGGDQVEPLTSTHDALATWPETATAVAVRLGTDDTIEISAPFGLDDLLDGVWRRNPRRVSLERSLARLERHQPQTRWPSVKVIPPQ